MTSSIISDLFQLNDLVSYFYIIRMLCSFSAGEGGDCSKNLWILRIFLCVRPPPLDNIKISNMLVTTIFRLGIKAPTNLPDILGSGGFVLDTVAPEVPCGELLPAVAFLSFSFVIVVLS